MNKVNIQGSSQDFLASNFANSFSGLDVLWALWVLRSPKLASFDQPSLCPAKTSLYSGFPWEQHNRRGIPPLSFQKSSTSKKPPGRDKTSKMSQEGVNPAVAANQSNIAQVNYSYFLTYFYFLQSFSIRNWWRKIFKEKLPEMKLLQKRQWKEKCKP